METPGYDLRDHGGEVGTSFRNTTEIDMNTLNPLYQIFACERDVESRHLEPVVGKCECTRLTLFPPHSVSVQEPASMQVIQ